MTWRTLVGAVCVGIGVSTLGMSPPSTAALAAAAAEAPQDDRAEVCRAAAATVMTGLDGFVAEMEATSTRARDGNLIAAHGSVRAAGDKLEQISAQLARDANRADDVALRRTVEEMAAEFGRLGRTLTDLTSLRTFDVGRLQELVARLASLCGGGLSGRPHPGSPVAPSTPGAVGPGSGAGAA